ncbi:hypothetical protein SAMN05444162_0137 [Paenibacillaceae bacterium GAS479]|nr:hypothetical protein SAMN05444162_0137 [Paenibacillaceae bacterium GAS479]
MSNEQQPKPMTAEQMDVIRQALDAATQQPITAEQMAEYAADAIQGQERIVDGDFHRRLTRSLLAEVQRLKDESAELGAELIYQRADNYRLQAENDQLRFEVKATEEHWQGEYDRCKATLVETISKVDHLQAEVQHWKDESEKWRIDAFKQHPTQDAYDAVCKALNKHKERTDRLKQERDELQKVLEFYGDEAAWDGDKDDFFSVGIGFTDRGQRARSILEKLKGDRTE